MPFDVKPQRDGYALIAKATNQKLFVTEERIAEYYKELLNALASGDMDIEQAPMITHNWLRYGGAIPENLKVPSWLWYRAEDVNRAILSLGLETSYIYVWISQLQAFVHYAFLIRTETDELASPLIFKGDSTTMFRWLQVMAGKERYRRLTAREIR